MHFRILFVGGGSVGHVAPAVAVWQKFRELQPSSQMLFICADRPDERQFLEAEHCLYQTMPAPRLNLQLPVTLYQSIRQSLQIFKEFEPQLIFAKGGNLSLPICLVAWLQRIPIIIHESDAVMGRANRLLQNIADTVCLGMTAGDSQHTAGDKHMHTGNPVRPDITQGSKEEGMHITGFSGDRPILLIMGGSQGARDVNEIIWKLLPVLTETYDVIHITGRNKGLNPDSAVPNSQHYWQVEFVGPELRHLYAIADVAVSRAGAGSISELQANSIPAVLVPLCNVPHAHQEQNARMVEQEGRFTLLFQEQLESQLTTELNKLMTYNLQLTTLSDPALQIAEIISHQLAKQSQTP